MSTDRNDLASSLAGSGRYEASSRWRLYTSWCEANNLVAYPSPGEDPELRLLRFVFAHWQARTWSAVTAKTYGCHVARTFRAAGLADPRGRRWEAFMAAAERSRPPQVRKIDAFSERQVLAVAGEADLVEVRTEHLMSAGVVSVCDALGLGHPWKVKDASALRRAQFTFRADGVVIQVADRRVLLTREGHPQHVRVLEAVMALTAAPSGAPWIAWPSRSAPSSARVLHRARLLSAWRRVTASRGKDAGLAEAVEWWSRAGARERRWLIAATADPHLFRTLQDNAYILTALCFGGRYSEMKRLRLDHPVESAEGYRMVLGPTEHKSGRQALAAGRAPRALTVDVPHERSATDEPGCVSYCPACALGSLLEVRRLHGASNRDRIFVGSKSGRRLTKDEATKIVRRVFDKTAGLIEDPGARRINTRSIRVTTATLARLHGMSLVEVGELLDHRWASTTALYVRRNNDYEGLDLTLPLEPPDQRS